MRKLGTAVFLMCVGAVALSASGGPPVSVGTKAKGAEKIVVATVTDVTSTFGVNQFGDRLIMSSVKLRVSETLKGRHAALVALAIEGGTVGDITLNVSDMPQMRKGERAVVFLKSTPSGGYLPHLRGDGVLELDSANRVRGTNLTLAQVRDMVRAASK